ncbi:hypothetical protein B5P44_00320 [Mycobacterium sp. CBMA 213]|uniref:Uncharacterized protein n=1 Tax=Mycolicibacterium sp. CBMA 213 TaxID=1968788 RepID=A0A343VR42_9MYCO|nr:MULTISPECIES: hypothetical protein [unclassified Mycolicibacterium]AVN58366.1 hypothetical protein B5P44_p00071 [Mycolicibacterium sp. CBMA 213]MUL61030.1 hypothetical protein [Mycolicibacterium sp. CBMA 335]MUM03267.1 hypothetical protein [Mycolicibacterium sp. CBMA 213]
MASVTDRNEIAETIIGSLAELDRLKTELGDKSAAVEHAENERDVVAEKYGDKITEILDTGWATAQALASQGHTVPKKRPGPARRRQPADGAENANADDQHNPSTDND